MNCCALSEQGDILICSKTETNKNPGRCRGLFCREGEQLKRFLEGLTRLELRKLRCLNFDGFAGLRIGVADNRQIRNVTENGPNDRTVSSSQFLGSDKPYTPGRKTILTLSLIHI